MIDLKNYIGSKGGAGVYQRIINMIPDASTILIPFVGSGQIFSRLDHTRPDIYINDYDRSVYDYWKANTASSIEVSNYDWREFLDKYDTDDCFIYLDPPYLLETRGNRVYYKHEFSESDHTDLIDYLNNTTSQYLLSHPFHLQYSQNLLCSSHEEYKYMSRGGLKDDCIWWNYAAAEIALNTYDYLGHNFTKRQQVKRQINNLTQKLEKLNLHTRDFIIRSVIDHFNYNGQEQNKSTHQHINKSSN